MTDEARDETPESIGAAMEQVQEDDFAESDAAAEQEDEGGEGEAEATSGDDDEGEGDEQDAGPDEGDGESSDVSLLSEMTPADLAVIRQSPELSRVLKTMNRGLTQKLQKSSEARRLVAAYEQDADRFIRALAHANGYDVSKRGEKPAGSASAGAVEQIGNELEELFGPQVGPRIRQAFEKIAQRTVSGAIEPLRGGLTEVYSRSEQARFMSSEERFIAKHKPTQQEYNAVVKLGESGQISPGEGMSPDQYLSTLLEVVRARAAQSGASRRLADKIRANRRDREPVGMGSKSGVRPVSRIKPTMSLEEAFQIAGEELEAEGRGL